MGLKMNAAQTKSNEQRLAERIATISVSTSLGDLAIARAYAEGQLEGMAEMGYGELATEAQQGRINKAVRLARKAIKDAA